MNFPAMRARAVLTAAADNRAETGVARWQDQAIGRPADEPEQTPDAQHAPVVEDAHAWDVGTGVDLEERLLAQTSGRRASGLAARPPRR